MDKSLLYTSLYQLIEKTCTDLPDDITGAITDAYKIEDTGSIAHETLGIILESIELSKRNKQPLCQDTGSLFAIVRSRPDKLLFDMNSTIREVLINLTKQGILRQNCVDTETGKNTGDNIGSHVPHIHYLPWDGPTQVCIMLKGGGSENMSTQYSLPHEELHALRDFEGVMKCLFDAVYQAQGKGCAPGILGVCVGGDRSSGYTIAKEQLFRKLNDINPSPLLADLEKTVLAQANTLNIGPMGLGGKTTLLGVKIGLAGRHPACYYVTISYSCWATRRYCIELNEEGTINKWL